MSEMISEFYTSEEASEILDVSVPHLLTCSRTNRLKSQKEAQKVLFYKQEIDDLKILLSETFSYKELVNIIQKETKNHFLSQTTVKSYALNNNFKFIPNPLNGKDFRFYKKDIHNFLSLFLVNYKPKNSLYEVISTFVGEYKNEFTVIESSRGYHNYQYIKEYCQANALMPLDSSERVLNYIRMVCKEQNISYYCNSLKNDIYIAKNEFSKFEEYHSFLRSINLESYYTNEEIKEMFQLVNTDRIAKYANAFKFKNKLYFEKSKVDEVKSLKDNTIERTKAVEILGIDVSSVTVHMRKLGIEYAENPLSTTIIIWKNDFKILEEHILHLRAIENAPTKFEKFKIETKNIIPKVDIPVTLEAFDNFILERFKSNKTKYVYTNLVNVYKTIIPIMDKEITKYSVNEVELLVNTIWQVVAKEEFSFFIEYCQKHYLMKFKDSLKFKPKELNETMAYTQEQWILFAILLFTEPEKLIEKAIEKRLHAMTWLYCALHYVCGWRASDMYTIPSPSLKLVLDLNEEEVIEHIKTGAFTFEMAQEIVNNVMFQINAFHKKPNKTKKKNIQRLKFVIDDTYVFIIGMLIALCEAHRLQNNRNNKSESIVTEISSKRQHHLDFFGQAYIDIFNEDTFQNNSAVKTFFNFTQTVSSEENWGQAYDIAAILRGHIVNKKSGIPMTTQVYYQHYGKKNNDINRITTALTERGGFSFMSHLLLKTMQEDNEETPYALQEWEEQTKAILDIGSLKPYQIEMMSKGIADYKGRVTKVFRDLMVSHKGEVKEILKKVSLGETPSKMEHSQCLFKSVYRSSCAYPRRENCIGCEFAMNEMYFLIEFNKRLQSLLNDIRNAEYSFDKERYTYSLFYHYMPILQEATHFFGRDRVNTFVKISKKDILNLKDNLAIGKG
ncbi:helix-turn-helix domain-containing protein [Paenibacillus sp. 22594]|uniref:helix-turn-helix domain-containing protein n=1 Tax=Paenibacillus sp. 22594 TaxID=3453947 RepID=UPI003F876192